MKHPGALTTFKFDLWGWFATKGIVKINAMNEENALELLRKSSMSFLCQHAVYPADVQVDYTDGPIKPYVDCHSAVRGAKTYTPQPDPDFTGGHFMESSEVLEIASDLKKLPVRSGASEGLIEASRSIIAGKLAARINN